MSEAPRMLIMAGGTGGHVIPGLALADEMRRRGWELFWLGTPRGIENDLVPAAGIPLLQLAVSGLRGRGLKGWLLAPWRVLRAVLQARQLLQTINPTAVVSFGGFAAGPGGLAAALTRRPLFVHEQNSVAGLTNRVLARFAYAVYTAFPRTFGARAELVGNPVRPEVAALPAPAGRQAQEGPLRVLVLGGSQGARKINELMPDALQTLQAHQDVRIVHQAGKRFADSVRERYSELGMEAEVLGFCDDMPARYGAADLVVARAGALTLAELCAAGLPAVLIPFPHAVDDHQAGNAAYLVDAGAAVMRREESLDAEQLSELLMSLCSDRDRLLAMAEAARSLARPNAASDMADRLLARLQGGSHE